MSLVRLDFESPHGLFRVAGDHERISEISRISEVRAEATSPPALLRAARRQVLEFLEGRRQFFDLPLAPLGSDFQLKVWTELQKVRWGSTLTYAELAARLGSRQAARAVGGAVGKNPILFAIPCHRVVAAGGKLGGFSAGTELKSFLLQLESGPRSSSVDARVESFSQLHI